MFLNIRTNYMALTEALSANIFKVLTIADKGMFIKIKIPNSVHFML